VRKNDGRGSWGGNKDKRKERASIGGEEPQNLAIAKNAKMHTDPRKTDRRGVRKCGQGRGTLTRGVGEGGKRTLRQKYQEKNGRGWGGGALQGGKRSVRFRGKKLRRVALTRITLTRTKRNSKSSQEKCALHKRRGGTAMKGTEGHREKLNKGRKTRKLPPRTRR